MSAYYVLFGRWSTYLTKNIRDIKSMSLFSKEINIIKFLQHPDVPFEVYFHTRSLRAVRMFNRIKDPQKWDEWKDSSAYSDKPPDFYSDNFHCMIEVMRVDDHAHMENGKLVNPTTQVEGEIEKELHKKNPHLWVSYVSDLPTDEDHRFEWYYENFKRIVEQHSKSISLYRKNHPGYKLVFLIFDESSTYFEPIDSRCSQNEPSNMEKVLPHACYADKKFLDVIYSCGADFCIWMTPCKSLYTEYGQQVLNDVHIFDLKRSPLLQRDYRHDAMFLFEVNPMDEEIKQAECQISAHLSSRCKHQNIRYEVKSAGCFTFESDRMCFIFKYRTTQSSKWKIAVVFDGCCLYSKKKYCEKTAIQDAKELIAEAEP